MPPVKEALIWVAILCICIAPLALAMNSPLMAWRSGMYIFAGLCGVFAFALLFLQSMLAAGLLPGLSAWQGRRMHRVIGGLLVLAVVGHVVGLWIESPPDVIDPLLFASPTPFSVWGVTAMWAVFVTAALAVARVRLRPRLWRVLHRVLAGMIVVGTVIHAVQIEGSMEPVTKYLLSGAVLAVAVLAIAGWLGRPFAPRTR